MMAGANKFLRIYYARVMERLTSLREAAWPYLIAAAVRANGFFPYAFLPAKKFISFCLFSLDFYLQVLKLNADNKKEHPDQGMPA